MIKSIERGAHAPDADGEGAPLLVDDRELARLLSMSRKWVLNNRYRIVGALKIGGRWRYDLTKIRQRVALGKDVIIKKGIL